MLRGVLKILCEHVSRTAVFCDVLWDVGLVLPPHFSITLYLCSTLRFWILFIFVEGCVFKNSFLTSSLDRKGRWPKRVHDITLWSSPPPSPAQWCHVIVNNGTQKTWPGSFLSERPIYFSPVLQFPKPKLVPRFIFHVHHGLEIRLTWVVMDRVVCVCHTCPSNWNSHHGLGQQFSNELRCQCTCGTPEIIDLLNSIRQTRSHSASRKASW